MNDLAIQIEHLSKKYFIGNNSYGTLRHSIANMFKKNKTEEFWALDKINLEINHGESIGIIGRNGAGKSTLLKILSKITYPTSGSAKLNGRVASLLEVGTGFHPELSGRENIYLNGSLLGMTRNEIFNKLEEIIEFSGVEKFIDTPVKHYSSGMYVRLAFSIAAHLDTEILLVDEILAVGDYEFQQKCLEKLDYSAGKKTVLFVSHDLNVINQLCAKSVWLENGKVREFGRTEDVVNSYKDLSSHAASKIQAGNKNASIVLLDNSVAKSNYPYSLQFKITNTTSKKLENLRLDVGIDDSFGNRVGWLSNNNERLDIEANKTGIINFSIKNWVYKTGKYSITTYLENESGLIVHSKNMDTIFTQSRKENLQKIPPDGQGSILLNYKIE